mgnify:CR=1 FL=1
MKRKIMGGFIAIMLVSVLIIGLLSINLVKQNYTTELESRLLTNAGLLVSFLETQRIMPDEEAFIAIVEDLSRSENIRVTIVNKTGQVVYDTHADQQIMDSHETRPEIIEAMESGYGKEIRYSSTVAQDMMYVAVPALITGDLTHVIRLSMDLSEIEALTRNIAWYIAISAGIGLVIAMILGFGLIDRIVVGIRDIVHMTQRMADGHYENHIYLDSNDELSELADHFNLMADKLNQTIRQLSQSNARFTALLASLRNPIVAVDRNKNISLINSAAEKLFKRNSAEVIGKHILELARHTELDDVIQQALEEHTDREIEVTLRNPVEKTLRIITSRIHEEDDPGRTTGLVVFMDDVTEIRKLEKVRSDFVTNVTHELKTPLTSISGFVETLKSGDIEDEATRQRFLDIIEIETERLTRLIDDILTLSEIENIRMKDRKKSIPPDDILFEVVSLMTSIGKNKGIRIHHHIDKNLPSVKLNEDRFKQMVINLVDNAIKYTPEGGDVTIRAEKLNHNMVLSVKDTGIGIPQKDIPRLFERFYRVDKGRSQKVGGTGLGLAIVKHIVLSMDGSIRVESKEGKGTVFVVTLPAAKD